MRFALGFVLGLIAAPVLIYGTLYVVFVLPYVEWR